LHKLCNGKKNITMAKTNDSIAYAYAISSKTQKLSVQLHGDVGEFEVTAGLTVVSTRVREVPEGKRNERNT
jgi:hypothetical protein